MTVSAEDQHAQPVKQPSFGGWMGSMWLYTLLRFGLLFALWGILVLVGLHGIFAPLLALVLSMPLSYFLLAGPRARFAANIERRVEVRKQQRAEFDAELSGGAGTSADGQSAAQDGQQPAE